jgi:hypothetical protein
MFIKHLNDLKRDVIEQDSHQLGPDSFLIFLDKIRDLTHSQALNELIMKKLPDINIDQLKTHKLLNTYQKHSADFKFEENVRMGEIKKFAEGVIPESRFIFDQYKVQGEKLESSGGNEDYFSFFGSHE